MKYNRHFIWLIASVISAMELMAVDTVLKLAFLLLMGPSSSEEKQSSFFADFFAATLALNRALLRLSAIMEARNVHRFGRVVLEQALASSKNVRMGPLLRLEAFDFTMEMLLVVRLNASTLAGVTRNSLLGMDIGSKWSISTAVEPLRCDLLAQSTLLISSLLLSDGNCCVLVEAVLGGVGKSDSMRSIEALPPRTKSVGCTFANTGSA